LEKLDGCEYNKQDIRKKIGYPNYQLTSREKKGYMISAGHVLLPTKSSKRRKDSQREDKSKGKEV
jgi:hypothetical protein